MSTDRTQVRDWDTGANTWGPWRDATERELDLERAADAAYDREDQAWFNAQSTEDLETLWAQACDIAERGAAWDDEVHEALAARDYFPAPAAVTTPLEES